MTSAKSSRLAMSRSPQGRLTAAMERPGSSASRSGTSWLDCVLLEVADGQYRSCSVQSASKLLQRLTWPQTAPRSVRHSPEASAKSLGIVCLSIVPGQRPTAAGRLPCCGWPPLQHIRVMSARGVRITPQASYLVGGLWPDLNPVEKLVESVGGLGWLGESHVGIGSNEVHCVFPQSAIVERAKMIQRTHPRRS
jgi:hypothetical protein